MSNDSPTLGPRGQAMWDRLIETFQPSHLEVIDESAHHAGRRGMESHFRVVVVAVAFAGKTRIERARLVNGLFQTDMQTGALHALSSYQLTPEEFAKQGGQLPSSPPCAGAHRR